MTVYCDADTLQVFQRAAQRGHFSNSLDRLEFVTFRLINPDRRTDEELRLNRSLREAAALD